MRMIDVGAKPRTHRIAVAEGRISMQPATLAKILAGGIPKGDVLAASRLAGIMAVKRTPDLLPLCHPISIARADVELTPADDGPALCVRAQVENRDRTGVEMEALTAVMAACLSVYDMCKSLDPAMEIGAVRLARKSGGKSGLWVRPGAAGPSSAAKPRRSTARRTR